MGGSSAFVTTLAGLQGESGGDRRHGNGQDRRRPAA